MNFSYVVYRVFSTVLPFVGLMNVLRRSLREPEYRQRISERFGYSPPSIQTGSIWIHAVSAGEVIAAASLLERLLKHDPDRRLLVTTTTPTGSAEVTRRFGSRVDHCYLPFDGVRCVRRFLQRVKPQNLLLMETELWPNLLHIARQKGIDVSLVNARLSDRSYRRYRKVRTLTNSMLQSVGRIASQYQDTADRFIDLGFPRDSIFVTGNIKFDLTISAETQAQTAQFRESWRNDRPCWIAASTHASEEETVLDAHSRAREKYPDLLLVLVPRHPRRADDVARLIRERSLTSTRLSDQPSVADVLLVDQMGVLLSLYGIADVAFIGGSLQETGGHNPVEPAAFGVPMLMGPNRANFEEVCKRFSDAKCLTAVRNSSELASSLLELLDAPTARQHQGDAAKAVVAANRGAADRLFELVRDWIR